MTEALSLDQLLEDTRHGLVLTYPRTDPITARRRVSELRRLGVTHMEFEGRSEVSGVRVLGKGCVGLVVIAQAPSGRAALKIRRVDSDRRSLRPEAKILKAANAVSVGPQLYSYSANFILMEFIEGRLLPDWVRALVGKGVRAKLRETLTRLVEDCFRLDKAGLDHGQLSRAARHVIVQASGSPRVVDFESASLRRRPSNVTSICQYLFVGSETARTITRLLGGLEKEPLIDALKVYKADPSPEALRRIKRSAGLSIPVKTFK